MGDSKFGALVLFAVVGFLAAAGNAAITDGAQATAVHNETLSVNYSSDSSVSESGVEYDREVSVYDKNRAELTRGVDYEWNQTEGNVTWLDTQATNENEQAFIDYTVHQVQNRSVAIAELIDPLKLVLALLAALILGYAALKGVDA